MTTSTDIATIRALKARNKDQDAELKKLRKTAEWLQLRVNELNDSLEAERKGWTKVNKKLQQRIEELERFIEGSADINGVYKEGEC